MSVEQSAGVPESLGDMPCQEDYQEPLQCPMLSGEPYHEIAQESSQNSSEKCCEDSCQKEDQVLLCQNSCPEELCPMALQQSMQNPSGMEELNKDSCAEELNKDSCALPEELYQQLLCPGKCQKLCPEKFQKSYVVECHDHYLKWDKEEYRKLYPEQALSQESGTEKYLELYAKPHLFFTKQPTTEQNQKQSQEPTESAEQTKPHLSEEPYREYSELPLQNISELQYSDFVPDLSLNLYQEMTAMQYQAIEAPSEILPPARTPAGMGQLSTNSNQKRNISSLPPNKGADQTQKRKSRTPCVKCNTASQTYEQEANSRRDTANRTTDYGSQSPLASDQSRRQTTEDAYILGSTKSQRTSTNNADLRRQTTEDAYTRGSTKSQRTSTNSADLRRQTTEDAYILGPTKSERTSTNSADLRRKTTEDVYFRGSTKSQRTSTNSADLRQQQGPPTKPNSVIGWQGYEVEPEPVMYCTRNPDSLVASSRPTTVRMCCEAYKGSIAQPSAKQKYTKPPPKPFCKVCTTRKPELTTLSEPQNSHRMLHCANCNACITEPQMRGSESRAQSSSRNTQPMIHGESSEQPSQFSLPNAAPSNYADVPRTTYHDTNNESLVLCQHCKALYERVYPAKDPSPRSTMEERYEPEYVSSDEPYPGCTNCTITRQEAQEKSSISRDYAQYIASNRNTLVSVRPDHACPNSKKKAKSPIIQTAYGYRPCQAPQQPEREFTVDDSKVDYMEMQSGSGRFVKNPLTISSCSCNIQKRFIPEPRKKSKSQKLSGPPMPLCEYSGSRAPSESMPARQEETQGIPPLNNNVCCANFVPEKYFQEKSVPKTNQRFSSGLAPRTSSISQRARCQPPNSSFARIRPESSLHLTKRRFKIPSRRLSGCGTAPASKKLTATSLIKPCTLRVPSKAQGLKCKQLCAGGKLTTSASSSKHTKAAKPKLDAQSVAAHKSNQASGSRTKRTQSTTVKRNRLSTQTQTEPKHPLKAKSRADLPTRYQPQTQCHSTCKSTAQNERSERTTVQKRVQKKHTLENWQAEELARRPYAETECGTQYAQPEQDDLVELAPSPHFVHQHGNNSAGCMDTNIHHFYRGSFLSIRSTVQAEKAQVASGRRQSLLTVAENIFRPEILKQTQRRGSSFVVPNKWQMIPQLNGFMGASAIVQLDSMKGSRTVSKSGGWSWRKLLPNWLLNSKTKATSA